MAKPRMKKAIKQRLRKTREQGRAWLKRIETIAKPRFSKNRARYQYAYLQRYWDNRLIASFGQIRVSPVNTKTRYIKRSGKRVRVQGVTRKGYWKRAGGIKYHPSYEQVLAFLEVLRASKTILNAMYDNDAMSIRLEVIDPTEEEPLWMECHPKQAAEAIKEIVDKTRVWASKYGDKAKENGTNTNEYPSKIRSIVFLLGLTNNQLYRLKAARKRARDEARLKREANRDEGTMSRNSRKRARPKRARAKRGAR